MLPVAPIRIDGLFELKQRGKRLSWPGTVTVTIGRPVEFPPEVGASEIAKELEDRLIAMERA